MRADSHSYDLVPTHPSHKDLIPSLYETLPSEDNSAKSVSSEDNTPVCSESNVSETHFIIQENLNDLARYFLPTETVVRATGIRT